MTQSSTSISIKETTLKVHFNTVKVYWRWRHRWTPLFAVRGYALLSAKLCYGWVVLITVQVSDVLSQHFVKCPVTSSFDSGCVWCGVCANWVRIFSNMANHILFENYRLSSHYHYQFLERGQVDKNYCVLLYLMKYWNVWCRVWPETILLNVLEELKEINF